MSSLLAERDALAVDFLDHAIFCRESLEIRNQGGSVVPVELYPGQIKLNAAKRAQQKRGKPVRLVVLKTRRSYFTAGACAEMFHEVPFFPGRKGLIIADKFKPAAVEAFDYLLQFQRGYKPFLRNGVHIDLPRLVKDNEQQLSWANGSAIDVLSAESGEVRGGGRHFTLCDEVAFWRAPEITLTGVLNMVPYQSETCVIIQSTANGIGGAFYDLCQQAMDPANESGWQFLFFGWLEHPPYQLPIEGDRAKFQASLDADEKQLQLMHGATLEQLNWRRKTISTECRGSVDTFNQEYPCTPQDAFLASGRPVFDAKDITRHPVREGTSGELEIIDDGGPQKRLMFIPKDRGALTIWQKPQTGRRYVCGADPSKGKDVALSKRGENPDWSVGFIADADSGIQVALLRGRIRPAPFADYLALVCRWYNWAYMVPESNDAGFIDAIVRTGYPLEYIYERQRDPTDRRSGRIEEIGFYTDGLTREWLIGAADDVIRNMTITILSAVVIQECIRFVIKPNSKKEHQDGAHDDCVFGLALAEIGRRSIPKRKTQSTAGPVGAKVLYYGKRKRDDEDD